MNIELSESLDELTQIFQYAIDLGYNIPSEDTILHVKLFLENLYEQVPQRYYIYIDSGGGINIYVNSNDNWISVGFYQSEEIVINGVINQKNISKAYDIFLSRPNEYIITLFKLIKGQYNG